MEVLDGENRYHGYVALGCVIRGETSHYDHVAGESIRGLQDLALRHSLAIGCGILTVENKKQAMARANVEGGDKGDADGRTDEHIPIAKRRAPVGCAGAVSA